MERQELIYEHREATRRCAEIEAELEKLPAQCGVCGCILEKNHYGTHATLKKDFVYATPEYRAALHSMQKLMRPRAK